MQLLLNWLWQGCVLAGLVAAILKVTPRASATTRYWVWSLALLLVLLLPVLSVPAAWLPAPPPAVGAAVPSVELSPVPAWPSSLLMFGWAAWLAISAGRIALALVALVMARRDAHPFPSAREARLPHWRRLRGVGRAARLVVSDRVGAAAVLGLRAPLIAVSTRTLAHLDDEELDQVLVHEWAHIQRRDDFTRVAQLVVRSIAGLHPAIWWIDRRLEVERETACDDYAVNVTGEPRRMAACLTKLASLPRFASGAMPAMMGASHLTTRVVRLLDRSRNRSTRRSPTTMSAVGATLIVVGLTLARVEVLTIAAPLTSPAVMLQRVAAGMTNDVWPASRPAEAPVRRGLAARASAVPREIDVQAPAPLQPHGAGRDAGLAPAPTPVDAAPLERRVPMIPTPSLPAALPGTTSAPPAVPQVDGGAPQDQAPWQAAAAAGVSVGRGSQKAAVATAGIFTKLGKKVASRF